MKGSTVANWNEAARAYSEMKYGNIYSCFCKEFADANVNDIDGLTVLDAGCGDGEYTELFRQKGAKSFGCDGSEKVIQIAKDKYPQCKFDVVDLSGPMPYQDGQFDLIFSNLVLMDIDPLNITIKEFARVAKDGGRVFFSIIHPAFYLGDWHKNEDGRIIHKAITSYITSRSVVHVWDNNPVLHYHRPISFYFNLLADAGFSLRHMHEPSVYEETKIPDIPLYLFAEYIKSIEK